MIIVRKPILRVYGPSGLDIVPKLGPTLLGVHITDQPGYESDECTIRVARKPPFMPPPAKGTRYRVEAMWEKTGPSFVGIYEVQRVHFGGDPESGEEMEIVCRAGDFADKLKAVDSEHFDEENGHHTAGDIFRTVAGQAGLAAVVSPAIDNIPIPYRLRWQQSRIDFLTDLGDDVGALVKPQGGKLVVTERGSGASGSGKPLHPIVIVRDPSYSYDVDIEPRSDFHEVSVPFFDEGSGRIRTAKKEKGADGARLALPHPYPSEAEAKKAAEAAGQEAARYVGTGTFEMAGNPDAYAGAPVTCRGFGAGIDDVDWVAAGVEHEISPESWVTSVETETKETAA